MEAEVRGRARPWAGAVLLLATVLANRLEAQGGSGRAHLIVGAGLNRALVHHAPTPQTGLALGRSMLAGIGVNPGTRPVAPRVALSYHEAPAEASRINTLRLDADVILAIARIRSMVPYLGGGIGANASWYDSCDAGSAPPAGHPCSGRRSGVGWQGTVGVFFPAARGPAAGASIRYMTNSGAFNGLVMVLELWL